MLANRRSLIALLLATSLALAACGQSAQDKAKAQVCNARADISKQVATLQGLTLSTGSVDQVKTSLTAILNDLTQIKNAQSQLNAPRKQQLVTATQTFVSQVTTIVTGLLTSQSLSTADAQLKSAATQLSSAYKQALAPVNCS